MKPHRLLLGIALTACASVVALAAAADPPARVGRVSFLEGEVSIQPPEAGDWTGAEINYPVTSGEAFWTGEAGRAELQIGPIEVRADHETELDVVDLDYGSMRLGLPQGSVELELAAAPEGGVVVATPAGDVRLDYAGLYRIDVGATPADGSYPPVDVTVFRGVAGAPSPGGPVAVYGGASAVIYAGYAPQFDRAWTAAIDSWSRARDQVRTWAPPQDMPPDMSGVEDLAGYGWYEITPDYGTVWYPRDTPADWAPYRYGRWAWVAPWGYTWIDQQPWGFAPFHYGRWARIDGRWGWIPGSSRAAPVYAPALVAFLAGVAQGGPSVGWAPLGPAEAYRPAYRVSDDYRRRVNAGQATGGAVGAASAVVLANLRNAQGATMVTSATLASGAPVQRALVPLSGATLATATALPRPALTSPAAPVRAAKAPPAHLQPVRTALAQPPAPNRPPAIPGAAVGPPPPRPTGFPQKTVVAPAERLEPSVQGRPARPSPVPTAPSEATRPVRPFEPAGRPIAPPAPARLAAPSSARPTPRPSRPDMEGPNDEVVRPAAPARPPHVEPARPVGPSANPPQPPTRAPPSPALAAQIKAHDEAVKKREAEAPKGKPAP